MAERKSRVLPVLAKHGVVRRGTEIELIPTVRPQDADQHDPLVFQASIDDLAGLQKSIRWTFDGQLYSLTELTKVLRNNYGATPDIGLYFSNWQRVGASESLYHEAERFPR
jgi:hypothetical protein